MPPRTSERIHELDARETLPRRRRWPIRRIALAVIVITVVVLLLVIRTVDEPPHDDSDLRLTLDASVEGATEPAASTSGLSFADALVAAHALLVEPPTDRELDFSAESAEPDDWAALEQAIQANQAYFGKLEELVSIEPVRLPAIRDLSDSYPHVQTFMGASKWTMRRVQALLHAGDLVGAAATVAGWARCSARVLEKPTSLIVVLVALAVEKRVGTLVMDVASAGEVSAQQLQLLAESLPTQSDLGVRSSSQCGTSTVLSLTRSEISPA